MSTLLIINGYAGAGKTTAAKKFAMDNDFALIEQDYFLFGMNKSPEDVPLTSEDHQATVRNMYDVALNYMELKKDLVIEGALVSISDKDPLNVRDFIKLGKQNGYNVVIATLIADEETRLTREETRGYAVPKEIDGMLRSAIAEINGKIEGELIIDTSHKSSDDVVQELEKLVSATA